MKRKPKSIWCFLDGKKHCDAVQWALAVNVTVAEAGIMLEELYPNMSVTFKLM